MRVVAAIAASMIASVTGTRDPETQKLLGIDPRNLTSYPEAEISKFYPPEMKVSMGPSPGDIFSKWDELEKVAIPNAPVIP